MKYIKSHIMFSKRQRYGIFLLILIVIALQAIYVFVDFSKPLPAIDGQYYATFKKERDSLIALNEISKQPKIYPFNPNFITDYKGYTLGMTSEEINKLLAYRKQNKWVNSALEFQQVTGVSDSLLKIISPYFKFPEWVSNPSNQKKNYNSNQKGNLKDVAGEKIDLNVATASQLRQIYGIGEKLSAKILDYRTKMKGFADFVELQEIYGLSPDVIEQVKMHFTIKTPRHIDKIPLNSASVNQLVTIKYIDYEIAHSIIEQRTLRENFKSFDELLKIKDFPINKFDIIKLYLSLD